MNQQHRSPLILGSYSLAGTSTNTAVGCALLPTLVGSLKAVLNDLAGAFHMPRGGMYFNLGANLFFVLSLLTGQVKKCPNILFVLVLGQGLDKSSIRVSTPRPLLHTATTRTPRHATPRHATPHHTNTTTTALHHTTPPHDPALSGVCARGDQDRHVLDRVQRPPLRHLTRNWRAGVERAE